MDHVVSPEGAYPELAQTARLHTISYDVLQYYILVLLVLLLYSLSLEYLRPNVSILVSRLMLYLQVILFFSEDDLLG
jgi:hypothetical protein